MKKQLHFKIVLFLLTLPFAQALGQTISSGIFGQNANLTDTVGTNFTVGGLLDNYWQGSTNYISESKTKFMRYGGIFMEDNCEIDGDRYSIPASNLDVTIEDYVRKAMMIQANGIEPMMTLPFKLTTGVIDSFQQAAHQAKLLVKGVNDSLLSIGYYPITYWVYSNEPEAGGFHNYDDSTAANIIHDYIKAYHDSIMTIWNSSWNTSISGTYSGPQFVGPELYSFDNYNHNSGGSTNKVNRLIEQLCGKYNQLGGSDGAFDIRPYISVFSWHTYPFNDESVFDANILAPTRQNVIDALASGATVPASYSTVPLKHNIDSLKSWLGSYYPGIKLGITEANICHINDVTTSGGYNITDDSITGNGANSFVAGQFYAEMMGICMEEGVSFLNFWSSVEGCSTCTEHPNYETNIGFINSDPGKFGGVGSKKSTFYHYKMIAEHFKGSACAANTSASNLKVFAARSCTGPVVLFMNQDTTESIDLQVKLNDEAFSPLSGRLNVTVDADIDKFYYSSLEPEESLLIVFDECGKPMKAVRYSEANNIANDAPDTAVVSYPVGCERCIKSNYISFQGCEVPEEEELNNVDTLEITSTKRSIREESLPM